MLAISKKIFSALIPFIIAPLILPIAFFVPIKTAEAQAVPVPVFDGIHTGVSGENAVQNTMSAVKEYVLDTVLIAVAKTIIKQISQATVQWINSGFQGSPAFIENPGQFFTGVADRVAGQFIEDLGFGFLCEPFSLDLQLLLSLEYGGGGNGEFEIGCTFSDIAGNIEGFVEGDFVQGGWDGWFDVTQRRNNNPYGAYLSAKSALEIQITTAKGQERMVLDWGDGFKSLTDGLGNILTPGTTIETQLSHALGTDLRQLELADEINEIMGALVGQLITQVMSATGLAGASSSSGGGFSTGRDSAGGSQSIIDPSFGQNITNSENLHSDTEDDSALDIDFGNTGFASETNETGTVNLALGKNNVSQAGQTVRDGGSFLPGFAVDGNTSTETSGDRPSMSITALTTNPWWQVDLDEEKAIKDIQIFRRAETGVNQMDALGTVRVFVSSIPFVCNDTSPFRCTVSGVEFNPDTPPVGMFATEPMQPDSAFFRVPVNRTGRYVRVQRVDSPTTNRRLQLAEVQVFRNNAPVITLNGSNRINLDVGEAYTEFGATAFDQSDADLFITSGGTLGRADGDTPVVISITQNGLPATSVNTNSVGQYIVTYTATDTGGAKNTRSRQITIVEPR